MMHAPRTPLLPACLAAMVVGLGSDPGGRLPPFSLGDDGVGEIDRCLECKGDVLAIEVPPGADGEVAWSDVGGAGSALLSVEVLDAAGADAVAVRPEVLLPTGAGAGALLVGVELPVPEGGPIAPMVVVPLAPLGDGLWGLEVEVPLAAPDGFVLVLQAAFADGSLSNGVALVFR